MITDGNLTNSTGIAQSGDKENQVNVTDDNINSQSRLQNKNGNHFESEVFKEIDEEEHQEKEVDEF